MSDAWSLWDRVGPDDRVVFVSEPETIKHEFRRFSALHRPSPKMWADAYLLAFACTAGLQLVTFDRGLRIRGAEVHVL